jgi:hypothetical protein
LNIVTLLRVSLASCASNGKRRRANGEGKTVPFTLTDHAVSALNGIESERTEFVHLGAEIGIAR